MTDKPSKNYKSPRAFEHDFNRRLPDSARQLVFFMERFVARVCSNVESAVLKGGLGLELRLDTPRTTKDADIIISASHDLDLTLSEAGRVDLKDFLRYAVTPDPRGPVINAPGMPYPGRRYKVQAYFATGPGPWPGNPIRKFSAEISIRGVAGFDEFQSSLDGFPLIPPALIRIYSLPWQIAEKVHAYTDPRHRDAENPDLMRPRDLLDICRIAKSSTSGSRVGAADLGLALRQTFAKRKQAAQQQQQPFPELPEKFLLMPAAWENSFMQEIKTSSLPWRSSVEAHNFAAKFLDPILSGLETGGWDPALQCWREPGAETIESLNVPSE